MKDTSWESIQHQAKNKTKPHIAASCCQSCRGIICKLHSITSGAAEVGLDRDQAMKNTFGNWPLHPQQADCDPLKDLQKKTKKLPLKRTGRWAEGHQDNPTQFENLDGWGQLNVECDGLAKYQGNACTENETWTPNRGFADESWSVSIEGKKLTKVDKQALHDCVFSQSTKAHWSRKHCLGTEMIASVNWDACQKLLNKLPFGKRRWLLKHATGFCGVGKMEKL